MHHKTLLSFFECRWVMHLANFNSQEGLSCFFVCHLSLSLIIIESTSSILVFLYDVVRNAKL